MLLFLSKLHLLACTDLPEVSWYALLWDLMAADEATSAHENLLGAKLYSADLSDKLEQIMAEAAPKVCTTVLSPTLPR